jgi:hypothetical protein
VQSLARRAVSTQFLPLRGTCGQWQKAIRRGKVLQAAGGSAVAGWCSLANIGKGNGRQGTRRMDARAFDTCKLASRHVTEAFSRAPHRARAICRVPQTMCALRDGSARNADCVACPRTTVPPTLKNVKFDWDQEVVYPFAHPISATGEVVGLQCSRAREGAVVKVAGMTQLQLRGRAHVFDGEACRAVESRAFSGITAPIPEGWLCGGTRGFGMGHVGPAFDLHVSEAEFAMRRTAWKAPPNPHQTSTFGNDADRVGPARTGAVAHGGSRAEVVGYAHI